MKYHHTIMTKLLDVDIVIQTNDVISHARMTRLPVEYAEAINRGLDYLSGQLKSVEKQHGALLDEVGK